ncbi:hypothetical protein [Haloferula sp.]|uniref:hypothetical protein n=1 Tax=Haloferula sp. TaxID=2497595 RepID=UPI003C735ECF
MPRNLYSPRLSDDVVRLLYREGQRRRMPMTRLADELIMAALAMAPSSNKPTISEPIAERSARPTASGKQAA